MVTVNVQRATCNVVTCNVVEKRWEFAPREPALESRLARGLRVSPVTAQLLVARGVRDLVAGGAFLRPALDSLHDPKGLDNMPAAVARAEAALRANERIGVFGDYDVDGISASAILHNFFRLLGRDIHVRIPHRVTDGYGLSIAAVDEFAAAGVRLMITVDCGTANRVEIAHARARGIDTIVLDHHEPPAQLPDACAIVNTKLPGSTYPFRGLCSAGLAFKFAWALSGGLAQSMKHRADFHAFLLDAMGLVALGTVADVSPLVGENRVLVRYGLDALRGCGNPGLRALVEKARLEDRALDTEDISFRLAPRLNALGRLGTARDAFELLTTTDGARIAQILELLESSNRTRRDIEHRIFEEARARVDSERVIVVSDPGWHVGVVGIVAARLVDEFGRPAFVLAQEGDLARGSGRSVEGFALHEALASCRELLVSGGGHARAAGLSLRVSELDRFRERINAVAAETMPDGPPRPVLRIDDEVPLAHMTRAVVREAGMLAPYGEANPPPLFVASHVRVAGHPRLMGKKNAHLSFYASQDGGPALRAVAFDAGHLYDAVAGAQTLSLAFTPQVNGWGGREEVELLVQDVKLV